MYLGSRLRHYIVHLAHSLIWAMSIHAFCRRCRFRRRLLRRIAVIIAVAVVHVDQFVIFVRILRRCVRRWVVAATAAGRSVATAVAALRFVLLLHSLVLRSSVLEPDFHLIENEQNRTKKHVNEYETFAYSSYWYAQSSLSASALPITVGFATVGEAHLIRLIQ